MRPPFGGMKQFPVNSPDFPEVFPIECLSKVYGRVTLPVMSHKPEIFKPDIFLPFTPYSDFLLLYI